MTRPLHLEHDWYPRPLPDNVVIGERSWCYSAFAFLHYHSRRPCGVRIGHDTGIYNGTFFDLGPDAEVTIGDNCTLVGAIIATRGRVVIGDYAFLAHEVVLADSDVMTPPQTESSGAVEGLSIILGRNSWVGARAIVLGGAAIGEGTIIAAGAVVRGVIPPFTIAAGNPARVIRQIVPTR